MCTYKSFFMFAFCRNFCRAHNGCICTEDRIFRNNAFQLCEQILFQLHIFQYTFYHKILVLNAFALDILCEADLADYFINIGWCHDFFFNQQFHVVSDLCFNIYREFIIYCDCDIVKSC